MCSIGNVYKYHQVWQNCGFTNMINLPIRQASKDRCFCPDSSLANASDLSDIDKDQDIDLIITGSVQQTA
jgi:hypothetical protein